MDTNRTEWALADSNRRPLPCERREHDVCYPNAVANKRPRLLDLFCGAGGCAVGYDRAGFDVTGVDNRPQPRFPFAFIQADALEYLAAHGHEFDAIHASPPCQRYSRIPQMRGNTTYPDLIGPTRQLLVASGKPWVIENVQHSPLARGAVMLCGSMFGMRTYRHRWFESSVFLFTPSHPKHVERCPKAGRRGIPEGGFISVCGHISQVRYARRVMGINWMTRDELAQAIPPAYTQFIGNQLRVFFRLTRQAPTHRIPDRVDLLLPDVDVVAACNGRAGVAQLCRHERQGRSGAHGGSGQPMTDTMQAGVGLDAVAGLNPPQLESEAIAGPARAPAVKEDWPCVCGHPRSRHPFGEGCAILECRCLEFEADKQRDGIRHKRHNLRFAGVPSRLVPVDGEDTALEVRVGPIGGAQLTQPNPRQSQEPQGDLERLIGQPLDYFQGRVGQLRSALGFRVAHRTERVAVDPLLSRGPLESGPDRVALGATGRNALPARMGFDEFGEHPRLAVGDRSTALHVHERPQHAQPFGAGLGTVDAFDGAVTQIEGRNIPDQKSGGFSRPFRGPVQAKCRHGKAPVATRRAFARCGGAARAICSVPPHRPATFSGIPEHSTIPTEQTIRQLGCAFRTTGKSGPACKLPDRESFHDPAPGCPATRTALSGPTGRGSQGQ